jgi:hypothetical protein
VIELRGSSEDGEDSNPDPMPVLPIAKVMVTGRSKPRKPKKPAAPKQNLMRDRPILSRVWMHEPDEVEEELEKGNPPRQPARR